jgi:hypothetical protein
LTLFSKRREIKAIKDYLLLSRQRISIKNKKSLFTQGFRRSNLAQASTASKTAANSPISIPEIVPLAKLPKSKTLILYLKIAINFTMKKSSELFQSAKNER